MNVYRPYQSSSHGCPQAILEFHVLNSNGGGREQDIKKAEKQQQQPLKAWKNSWQILKAPSTLGFISTWSLSPYVKFMVKPYNHVLNLILSDFLAVWRCLISLSIWYETLEVGKEKSTGGKI